jgi:hypothetical protein
MPSPRRRRRMKMKMKLKMKIEARGDGIPPPHALAYPSTVMWVMSGDAANVAIVDSTRL